VTEKHEKRLDVENKLISKPKVTETGVRPSEVFCEGELSVVVDDSPLQLPPLGSDTDESSGLRVINIGGLFSKMVWAGRRDPPYYLVISTAAELPRYGQIFTDPGYL
jgi:hypothetical protein